MNVEPLVQEMDACLEDAYMCFHAGHDDGFSVQCTEFVDESLFAAATETDFLNGLIIGHGFFDLLDGSAKTFGILFSNENRHCDHLCQLDEVKAVSDHRIFYLHGIHEPFLDIDDDQNRFVV
jgi:hypothetical protein